jgi:hypothetical protein
LRLTGARNAFDTKNLQAEDMDMGELTREELSARLEAVEARIDARARATDSKIEALEAKMNARFAEFDARMQKNFADMIKWMVGTAIAMTAVGMTFLIFLFGNFTPRQQAPIVITVPSASAPAPQP